MGRSLMRGTLLGDEISSRNCNKGNTLFSKASEGGQTHESCVLHMLVSDEVLLQVGHIVFFEDLCARVSVLTSQRSLTLY